MERHFIVGGREGGRREHLEASRRPGEGSRLTKEARAIALHHREERGENEEGEWFAIIKRTE